MKILEGRQRSLVQSRESVCDEFRPASDSTEYCRKKPDKLDWMYAGSVHAADREEYLLGKPVDRGYFKQEESKVIVMMGSATKNSIDSIVYSD